MSATDLAPTIEEGEQHFVLDGIGWDQYVTINDAFPDQRGLRMIYIDGSLTFLTLSRRHDWFENHLDKIVMIVALNVRIEQEVAGSATFPPGTQRCRGRRGSDLLLRRARRRS